MAEKVREADGHWPKRWVTGHTTSSNQHTLRYEVPILIEAV